jgi:Ca2+-binding EF-hand superfamily protein
VLDYRDAFDVLDDNHDGRISEDDLKRMMAKLGQITSDEEIALIMKMADKDC